MVVLEKTFFLQKEKEREKERERERQIERERQKEREREREREKENNEKWRRSSPLSFPLTIKAVHREERGRYVLRTSQETDRTSSEHPCRHLAHGLRATPPDVPSQKR